MRKIFLFFFATILILSGCSKETKTIQLSKNYLEIETDSNSILTCTIVPEENSYTWSSTDESVAIVTNGKIYAMHEGKTIIIVESTDGKSDSCEVVVKNPEPTIDEKIDKLCTKIATSGAYGIDYNQSQKTIYCKATIASGSTYEDACLYAKYYPTSWASIIESSEGVPKTIYKEMCDIGLSDWKIHVDYYTGGRKVAYAETSKTGTTSKSLI